MAKSKLLISWPVQIVSRYCGPMSNVFVLIKEILAALLRGKYCERSELPFEFRACSMVHTFFCR
jgi:hypothetical protein